MQYMLLAMLYALSSFASVNKKAITEKKIDPNVQNIAIEFRSNNNDPKFIKELKNKVLELGTKSVPTLIKAMKDEKISDQKRWMATFSLGRIMGKKSIPLLAKYTRHPNWMLRLAGLKTLLALDAKTRTKEYADALKDRSMIVRMQALENIRYFGITDSGDDVWRMVFHKHNYSGEKGSRKRTRIISKAIRTLGDLKFVKVQKTLVKLIQKDQYRDIASDIDYALQRMSGKQSPKKNLTAMRAYWKSAKL